MDATIGKATERVTGADPAQRSAALADARQRASQAALQSAKAGETRKMDQRETTRTILERAIGANTRLSIARNGSNDTFVYRAIDVNSGEVIIEWPPVQFAKFLVDNGAAAGLAADALQGLVLDEQA